MKASSAYLIAPFLGFLLAQVIKYALASRHDKNRRQFFRSGNMPSSHTAVVVSLATVIYVHEGLSTLFSVAAVLAVITIYDALVARRSIGEQGAARARPRRQRRHRVRDRLAVQRQAPLATRMRPRTVRSSVSMLARLAVVMP